MGGQGGKGTPWGPSDYGTPSAVTLQTDPTQIATPGIQQEMQQIRTTAGQQQGASNNAAMAALQRAGVAGGSETSNALGNIAGQTALGTGQALSGLQQQQFGEQASLMDALNKAAMAKYQNESYNNLGENSQRQSGQSGAAQGVMQALPMLAALF